MIVNVNRQCKQPQKLIRQDQNDSIIVNFDVSDIINDFGEGGTWSLKVLFPRTTVASNVGVDEYSYANNVVTWVVGDTWTYYTGDIKTQLTYSVNGKVIKDFVYKWAVPYSLRGSATPPDPMIDWQTAIDNAVSGMEDLLEGATAEYISVDPGDGYLTFDAETFAFTFGIPKGEKGDTGATPHLTVGTVETTVEPSVIITGTDENPVLNFGLVKGDKGDRGQQGIQGETGAPAGFGTVSATVDANIGTPSVEVTASGADTAKNFAFAFHNLKGQKGDKGDPGDVSQAQLDAAVSDLKSDISDINNILGNTSETKTKSGSQIEITDAVVGDSITSISGSGLINNGNILPSSLLSKTYTNPDATTESITSNKWGFALVSASDLNSILKAGKKYTLSYDFELVEVKNATIANKEYGLMMSGGVITPPYKSTAENHHDGYKFSVVQKFTVPAGGFTASLNFYNGGNYNDDICTLTNLVISCEDVNSAWKEANNVILGDESTVTIPYIPMYIDSDDDSVSVEYLAKGTTRLDDMESVSSGIIAEMSEMKIATNPHIKNICHRGLAAVAPEDTAPAYVAAKMAGFEYVENDLWFTSDGVPVMVHARDLSLVSDGTGNVDEVTYSYFKSLDFGQADVYGDKYEGLKGLSFEEFVVLCKALGLYMYLDCKSFSPYPDGYNNGIEVCLEILEKHSFTKNVTWIVGLSGVASVRNLIPDARVAYIIGNTPSASDIDDLSNYILNDDPDATLFDVNDSYITAQSVIDVHNAGLKIEAWRSEIPPTESAILETALKGIDGYTNDGANIDKIITNHYKQLYGL